LKGISHDKKTKYELPYPQQFQINQEFCMSLFYFEYMISLGISPYNRHTHALSFKLGIAVSFSCGYTWQAILNLNLILPKLYCVETIKEVFVDKVPSTSKDMHCDCRKDLLQPNQVAPRFDWKW
jgi:hypothetical protein